MTVEFKKTYTGINTEMFLDEIRDLLDQWGILAGAEKLQTYSLPNGTTQSRVTLGIKTKAEKKDGGNIHLIGTSSGETQMYISLDEDILSQETISSLVGSINLVLDSYEVKW